MKRILVLYRELAGYFVHCLNHLCDHHEVEAHVVAYPVNADAPFQFQFSQRVKVELRSEHTESSLRKLVSDGNFDLIFSGGWSDREYLKAIRHRKCKALLGFDNQWNGSFKHILSSVYGKIKLKPLFDYAFVPGTKQIQFAKHLGFDAKHTISGAYSCDVNKFSRLHPIRLSKKSGEKKLIYTGRYAEEKFIQPLWQAISEMKEHELNGWTLHCAGTGPLWHERMHHEHIVHHGFLQPDQLIELMKVGDAFILPSTFEPWGVVVHEFAAAGYPLLLSDAVGSAEAFLQDRKNGYLLRNGDKADLRENLLLLFQQDEEELHAMGNLSAIYAQKITPETWAKGLHSIM
jgi:glycosyltransferase involved in cell wall biosynthesis